MILVGMILLALVLGYQEETNGNVTRFLGQVILVPLRMCIVLIIYAVKLTLTVAIYSTWIFVLFNIKELPILVTISVLVSYIFIIKDRSWRRFRINPDKII